jgi:hypothetical protein
MAKDRLASLGLEYNDLCFRVVDSAQFETKELLRQAKEEADRQQKSYL